MDCDLCEYSTPKRYYLSIYISIYLSIYLSNDVSIQDFKVDCDLCEYSTPKRYYLKEHMIKTHGIQLKKEATDEQL